MHIFAGYGALHTELVKRENFPRTYKVAGMVIREGTIYDPSEG